MPPIYIKGGAWSNLEDQILKAAIQKYGPHQWAKCASLLQKKTAKQCEIRWSEFLNPKLNNDEFTPQEDEKLLSLSRKLPNQWRTIAGLMGRTAQMCIDRYNTLLDDLTGSDLKLGSSLSVGDVNPQAETLTAKLDTMDDEEREMLSEARARLMNTQGKKATRKVRERMLEESKRMAYLQKRRELKESGISTKLRAPRKKYKTEIDYNQDVAWQMKPIEGKFDTTEEDRLALETLEKFEKKVDSAGFQGDEQQRKKRSAETQHVAKPEAIVHKKPKFELSAPGALVDDKVDSRIMESAQAITAEKQQQSVLIGGETVVESSQEPVTPVKPKMSLAERFAQLPTPLNDYEIEIDEDEEEVNVSVGGEMLPELVPDLGLQQGVERVPSQVVQRGLPIPESVKLKVPQGSDLESLIQQEFLKLVTSDYAKFHHVKAPIVQDIDKESYDLVIAEMKEVPGKKLEINGEPWRPSFDQLDQLLAENAALEESLRQRLSKFHARREAVLSVQKDLATKLSQLQRHYALYYNIYEQEAHVIANRTAKLQDELDPLLRTQQSLTHEFLAI